MNRSCRECREFLTLHLAGDLHPAAEAGLKKHLETCPDCQAALDALRPAFDEIRQTLSAPPEAPLTLSPDRRTRILNAARRSAAREWTFADRLARWMDDHVARKIQVALQKSYPQPARTALSHVFTILIVIGIIGILSGLMLPSLSMVKEKGRRAQRLNQLEVEAYKRQMVDHEVVAEKLDELRADAPTVVNNLVAAPAMSEPPAADAVVLGSELKSMSDFSSETRKLNEATSGRSDDSYNRLRLSAGKVGVDKQTKSEELAPDSAPKPERPASGEGGDLADGYYKTPQPAAPPPAPVTKAAAEASSSFGFGSGGMAGVSPEGSAVAMDPFASSVTPAAAAPAAPAAPEAAGKELFFERDEDNRAGRMKESPIVFKGLYAGKKAKADVPGERADSGAGVDGMVFGQSVAGRMESLGRSSGDKAEASADAKAPARGMALRAGAANEAKRKEAEKAIAKDQLAKTDLREPLDDVSGVVNGPVPAEEKPATTYFRAYGVNPYIETAQQPFSTFSIDVDTASYTYTRNSLLQGRLPPPESVRTEEIVNFFDYHYSPPAGDALFAVHAEGAPSPFRPGQQILRIGVKARHLGREENRAAVLTFLVDTSGSMSSPDRLGLVQQALRLLVDKLGPTDRVALIQFDNHARLVLDYTPASDKARILKAIDALQTSGSTNLEEGMRLGYECARRAFIPGASNRVLLLSDGAANLGGATAEEILAVVADSRRQGIFCSVYGVGRAGLNDVMLETLANKGDGAYVYLDSLDEARRVFVDDLAASLNTVAADVKIQVEFMPARVAQYRQIGYENRQLKKEDFRNDAIDAGEVGSGQSVTALYELGLVPSASGPLGVVRIRYRDLRTGKVAETAAPLPESLLVPIFDKASPPFRLSAGAAEWAEILRGSPYAEGDDPADAAALIRRAALDYPLDARVQELLRLADVTAQLKRR